MGYEYLDSRARKLKETHPPCADFIDRLLIDYKSKLDAGLFKGVGANEVEEQFIDDVKRDSCSRKSKRPRNLKPGGYKRAP